jgi:serine/threonine protein kinase
MERKEIIHRDIKPANLLINKNAVIKLCDFGISRSFARLNLYFNDLDDTDYCALSPLLHTENYMPPRIKGVIQDDMWSLGITLLEVISGRNPFADWNSRGRYFPLMDWKPVIPVIKSHDMQQLILHL